MRDRRRRAGILLRRRAGILLSVLVLLNAVLLGYRPIQSAPPTYGVPDRRFGVIGAYDAPQAATALGAGWTRVVFDWNQIQPEGPDTWVEFPVADATLDAEIAAGRELIGLINTVPGWAYAQFGGKNVPRGLDLPIGDPGNVWATFVRTLVARHRGRINHWIIWNEPDIWGTEFQSWGGTVEEFARLLEVAYHAARAANPNVVLHLPAVTHWWDANYGRELFMRRLLDVLTTKPEAADHGYYFDAFTLHLYFNADTIYDLSQFYHGLLAEYGLSKPLWIVETNAPPSNDPTWPVEGANFQITQEDQAAFMVQGLAMALAGGAQRVGVYKLKDTESDHVNPEPFGLVRMDGSHRPAFHAYQVATTYLAGFRSAELLQRDAATVVRVRRVNGWTTAAWARGPEAVTVQVPAQASSARLIDVHGNVRWISARGGVYTLQLPGSPCTHPASPCLIGGAPSLLVEGGLSAGYAPPPSDASMVSTPTPTPGPATTAESTTPTPTRPGSTATATANPPTSVATPTVPASPTATATPTRTPSATATATPTPTPSPSPTSTATPTATATAFSTVTATADVQPTATPTAVAAPSFAPGGTRQVLLGILGLMGILGAFIAGRKLWRAK
jgi:hypothetical protein